MFEQLTERLNQAFKSLTGRGKLSEKNIADGLREVRRALLEADVNFKVVKSFIESVQQEAVGEKVMKSITPGQQIIKIVHDKLVDLLGGRGVQSIKLPKANPTIVMLVGLQGSGKTTHAAKLAVWLRERKWNPAMVALDVYRPAAAQQLQILGNQISVPVIVPQMLETPLSCANRSIAEAQMKGYDILILDTAGRLQIDDEMMRELEELQLRLRPQCVFLVVDAMTGQTAVEVGQEFARRVGIDGFILTKLDGDAKGGAALSLRAVVGKPILFIGTGEKTDAIEPFYPDRMANRILGMGDVVSLVEKAQKTIDEQEAEKMRKKLLRAEFTFSDFLKQLKQIKKMGPLEDLLKMIPGAGKMKLDFDEKEFSHIEAIINSMTPEERENPDIINGSRRKRIARGSGTSVQQVNRLLKEFVAMQQMFKKMKKGRGKGSNIGIPFGFK
ncbi:signal recognition particle protein [bacterium]|nr:signal recognition particle protein [bacterium]